MRSRQAVTAVFAVLLASCGNSKQPVPDPSAVRYQLRGQVVRLNFGGRIATIRHERIEGWMDAMTMEFPVQDERGFGALHAGDRVTATVMVGKQSYWISEIHREF